MSARSSSLVPWGQKFIGGGVFLLLLAKLTFFIPSCGAGDLDSPPEPLEPAASCIPPRELAPELFAALASDDYQGLREIVRTTLAACTLAGEIVPCSVPGSEAPVAGVLLKGVFSVLGDFVTDEPEVGRGSTPGTVGYCASLEERPPEPNRLCTIMRALNLMIHSRGEGGRVVLVNALDRIRPLLADLLRYVDGTLADGMDDRYEDLAVIRRMVRRCDEENTVAFLLAIMDVMRPPRGQVILEDLLRLIENDKLQTLLSSVQVDDQEGRRGVLRLARIVSEQLIRRDYHPDELRETLEQLLYPFLRSALPDSGLEEDVERVVGHLVEALDPMREPLLLGPLQGTMSCAFASDPGERLPNAVYDILFAVEIIGIDDLFRTIIALFDMDPTGAVLEVFELMLSTMAQRLDMSDAMKQALWVLLEERHARVVLPAAVSLLESGVLAELIALMDQMLSACAVQGFADLSQ